MNTAIELNNNSVWRRIALITSLLILLVGPNFGPIPLLLRQSLSLEASVVGMLVWFWASFVIILAIIFRLSGTSSIPNLLRSLGLGAPSSKAANVVGLLVGLLWGALLLTSIFQFDPNANITQINAMRIFIALFAAGGALLEDLITRGFLMNQMREMQVSNWLQALISALVFAVYHTIFAGFNIFSFIFSMVYGLMLAGLFLWGKRSMTPVILGHSLAVLIAEPFASMLIFLSANL